MFLALALAVVSVALGAALALVPRPGLPGLGPVRSFAVTAALGVVALQLVPGPLTSLGAGALLAFAAGLLVPRLARAASLSKRGDEGRAALEMSFWGLAAHRFGDGIALGALAALGADVVALLALAAHVVPVTAAFVLAAVTATGRRGAALRAAALVAASAAGVLLTAPLEGGAFASLEPWLTALVAGLLVDVVLHDHGGAEPATPGARALDVAAAISGAAVATLGADPHGHLVGAAHDGAHAVGKTLLAASPATAVALGVAFALERLTRGRDVRLRRLVSTPGITEVLVLGPVLWGGAAGGAAAAAALLAAFVGAASSHAATSAAASSRLTEQSGLAITRTDRVLPALLLGLVAASVARTALPGGVPAATAAALVATLVLLAASAPVSPVAWVPVLAVLTDRGVSPWACVVVLGAATLATASGHATPRARATLAALAGCAALLTLAPSHGPAAPMTELPVPVQIAAAALLFAATVHGAAKRGTRAWLATAVLLPPEPKSSA